MVKLGKDRKKLIARDRWRFFYREVAIGFILIFLLLLIPAFLVPLILGDTPESPLYGLLFYSLKAILVFIGVPLTLTLSNILFETQKTSLFMEEDISPAIGHLRLFKMTKKNYKYQILYGILIFFLIFLPLDFFILLLVPGILEYQAISVAFRVTDYYLLENNYFIFLVSVIIIQFSVAISEETIQRGLVTKRGSEQFFRMSAVLISALSFGLGHFAYFLDPISRLYPFWYPFIWFFQTFFAGIILALLVLRRKWLFPAILAHALNNILAAHAFWSLLHGVNFSLIILYIYYPLLIIGSILVVWYFSLIKSSLSIGLNMIKDYFKFDEKRESTKGDRIFRVLFDILMGILIFIMSFMIAI
ncbi:MAG: CPBP family intramembrane glutamic endopeptidase [Candidatus Hodarchaeota archaeon]